MITQRVKLDVNNQQGPTIYARMGEKNLRQIVFILTRKDEESGEDVAVDIPAGAVGQLRILKPSNNFVIVDLVKSTLESGSVIFTATLPDQAVTVGGLCYYDVRIEETTSKFIFSVTGHMVVDDSVISSGVLEDVSEVNGLVFPDDFLTKDDGAAVIDDSIISSSSVWSSLKTNHELINAIESMKHVYSTNERVVGVWLDGRPIYEKTIVRTNTTWGGTIDTGITDMETLITANWFIAGGLNVTPSVTNNGSYIRCQHNGNGVLLMQGGSFDADPSRTWYLTLTYLKEGD